ncbi:Mbeg1-like protein [Paenibacillus aurantiacus]|uniref:Mbeg1-like protein n=1 Tax=Paenibacillus aurantiacus TaxID=1936118 RepID=A0ABV5KGT3_9BACL
MSGGLSENELRQLAQLVYLDVKGTHNGEILDIQWKYAANKQITVGQLIDFYTGTGEFANTTQGIDKLKERFASDLNGKNEYEHWLEMLNKMDRTESANWVISDVVSKNKQEESGFVAFTVTTTKSEKVAVFRGSEPIDDPLYRNDWKNNGTTAYIDESVQQKDAEAYMSRFNNYNGDLYLTGHSLGGNLALYSSFILPDDLRKHLITATTFNAPGFNRGVLDKYASQIAEMNENGQIREFRNRHDIVPALFSNPSAGIYIDTLATGVGFAHHSMFSLMMNGDGETFKRSDKQSGAFVPRFIQNLTVGLEVVPARVKELLLQEAFKMWDGRFEIQHFIIGGLALIGLVAGGPAVVVTALLGVVRAVVALVVIGFVLNTVIPMLQKGLERLKELAVTFFNEAVDFITETVQRVVEMANLIGDQIVDFAKKVKDAVTGFMTKLKDGLTKFINDTITAVKAKWDALVRAKDAAVRKIGDVFGKVKAKIKQDKDEFIAGVKSFKNKLIGKAKSGLTKTIGKIAAAAAGVARGARILANLDQLESLHRTLQRKEERLEELAERALSIASGVSSGVGRSYNEYYVQNQIRQVQSLCDAVRTEKRRVAESMAHYAKGLKFTLDKYRTMEAKLVSLSRAALR